MVIQEKGEENCYNSGQVHVSTPTILIHLDNGVQPKKSYVSRDEMILKARKPYTITKQREKWTEEEHKKFLEALKLYGRAWRCIEEHVGTKTAVQIRSHAQKFFSKVVRESSHNLSSMNSIEIPPPRPKRKPLHPYPRKLVHQSTNGLPISEQPERSSSPISSISEQENLSPSSVLYATESDTVESTFSNPSNGCPSPVSSATGPFPVDFFVDKQENGCLSPTSSVEKDGKSPSPVKASAGSSHQDKPLMELEMSYKDHDCAKEPSSAEVPTLSLKLFGKTVLVTDSRRTSSSTVRDIAQQHKASPPVGSSNKPENVEPDVQKQAQASPRNTAQRDYLPRGQCQSEWNPWLCGISPVYCMQFKQADTSRESSSPVPCWALPLLPIQSNDTISRAMPSESCIHASGGKESNKNGHSTGSNTKSVTEVGLGDGNSGAVDSQNSERVKEPIGVVSLKASESSAFLTRKACSDGDEKGQAAVFCLKASKNSAFSSGPVVSRNFGKGFVPYKRCVSERDVQQPQIGSEEREGQRIRLCL